METFANVHHPVAEITSPLAGPFTFAQLLQALFPGGSITGCPEKIAAMRCIRELESNPRRIYTGLLGSNCGPISSRRNFSHPHPHRLD